MMIMKEVKQYMNYKNSKENQERLMEFFEKGFSNKKLSREEKRYIKYSNKFKEKFGRNPYIAEPSGTRKQTLLAIKKCLKQDKDILDELLYPNNNENVLY